VKSLGAAALFIGLVSFASAAHAQTANSQSDARDYEALAYLPKDTLVALAYFRAVSTSDKSSFTQSQGILRASYILKYGNLSIVPFDALLPVVDVAVYTPMTTLHTSGVGDLTYLPSIGYTIPENETTHTVIAGTAYITGPSGTYDAANPVNIGDNRWRLQPQVGVSQRFLKLFTVDLIGSLAFYTKNSAFFTPKGFVTMSQNQTFGLEAHVAADLSPDMFVGLSYYLAAIGEQDVESLPALPLSEYDAAHSVQTLRFTFGIRAEKATLILLQYNQDIEESGGTTPITRFFGARLSHAVFF
jgi:Putative MetA-pathway of phenol degradation